MKKFWNKYKEIITYIIFGVLTTVVSWATYNVFVGAVKMPVWLGNALSWICAVTFAYVTNKLWVFESKSWNIKLVVKEIISFSAQEHSRVFFLKFSGRLFLQRLALIIFFIRCLKKCTSIGAFSTRKAFAQRLC